MAITDTNGLSAADVAAVTGNGGFGGFGNDGGLFWLLVLFLFGFGNNGWGNNSGNDVQRGFDQSAIMNGISGIQTSANVGFGDIALGIAGVNQNISQIGNANQVAMLQGFNGLQSQFANCCCENRLGIANLGADIAREACADRQAVSEALMGVTAQNNQNTNAIINAMNIGFQNIQNQNYQDKIDAKDTEIANLRTQLNMQNLAASQAQQTAQLVADNAAQTQYVVNRVAPYPVPSFNVNPPYNYGGCGCNMYNA